jgi:hypothetical protein
MTTTTKGRSPKEYAHLRDQAEERIKRWLHYELDDHTDLHELVHELKIHLAEQEIMNEELMQTMKELRQTMNLMADGKKDK